MGHRLADTSVLLFQLEAEDGTWAAARYEILKYSLPAYQKKFPKLEFGVPAV